MIPEAAVEAAAIAFASDADPWGVWGEQSESYRTFYRNRARPILEAAAPHMLAGSSVDTVEELDALPIGSVVLAGGYLHHANGMPVAFQRWTGGEWHRGARSSSTHPDNIVPATVLHRGAP